ncbi:MULTISPECIES: SurA N-terminal domain-containing protein [unclassified Cupriavidus]|uniref:SurA N-terminal domain-containing protein n=1 Tax=unclassified Cupriavidus TaxID=2640874 RepID=UPI001C003239|nr:MULTISPECIES: SurA N-terminal domain-containing protein [unclassified Cupriavidus]MCA3189362.1 SurA N-terminal domain-containing protein [Cupriavidus sp.]MCA3195442.1 SurA N-terminal domain-containing protein [Cupriavidus sp.]MCA3200997.1 SurA N-terminal domain-containing protein [Cupriavidus sp.]MCA3208369.1 SurA N-terminal domain-containing protein [Cupriavidus sp.]MCA3236056.1 SurA N-terminal domain-containing protein [Cupriavidus sp.]
MLDFVRNNRRLMLLLLLVLVFPSFVFFGVESYSRFMDSSHDAAKVDGRAITVQEVDNVVRDQTERMRQMLGNNYDPRMFEGAAARQSVLDQLILQRVVADATARKNLTVSNEQLRQAIEAIPAIAQLRGPDGKFDEKAYIQLLAQQGMTPEQLDARMRFELATQQLGGAVGTTAFVPKSLLDRLIAIRDQQRDVQALVIKPADFTSKVTPDAAALKAYYEAHLSAYTTPEQAKVEYVVLSGDAMAASQAVTPEELKSYYDSNAQRFRTEEQRRASHILITVPKDAKDADRKAAKDKAEKLLEDVRKHPETFADVAKKNSQDPGSAEKGGDLGFMGRGALVKPFEDAMYALKDGQISDLVETDYGYHIIKLTGIKPAATQPLDEVRPELEAELKKQLAAKKYAEQADAFGNTVYEQSDSLKPAADKFKLAIQTADNVTRQPNPALGKDNPLNNDKVLKALFSDDAIKNKRNTEAVQVGPTTLVAARIVDYRPATARKFEDVEAQVRQAYVAQQAAELARKDGEAKLEALKKADNASGFGPMVTVSRAKADNLSPKAVDAIMRADATKLPSVVGVDLGADGYAIYRITKVGTPPEANAAQRQADAQQLSQLAGQTELAAYYEALKAQAKVKILHPAKAEDQAPASEAAAH